ncbi:uncharacterized protein LTR77_010624 [Saxophila tyrrhenica]|uniref:ASST-domain-containing protein n=1 Tax=Saxophila tyrrhenica TaxID=1690608 RepID=A0AAV9NUP2_9PEZI|nr:hypothetical protein LTR77_010624 [Saxophila tyrrhenica]
MAASFSRLIFLAVFAFLFCSDTVLARRTPHAARDAGPRRPKHKKPDKPKYSDEETYFSYVSRPDIQPIRWEIKNFDKEALAPGYWFLAPYAALEQSEYNSWNGPHIYDQKGELIWSGSPMFNNLNIYDFRLAEVGGKMMPTMIFTEHSDGLILDEGYNIHHTVDMFGMELPDWLMEQIGHRHTTNMHDFNVIDDGKRAVMLTKVYENATKAESKAVGFDGECTAKWQGFKEVDVATGEILFEWNAHGHIQLEESTYHKGPLDEMCNGNAGPGGWDILHLNSIDKFPDGDYLLSARHTNTLYKVSHEDGSIVWRLEADHGDFKYLDDDAKFRRQHHARVVSANETHSLVTVFNNARGTGKAEHPLGEASTGLLLSLRTDTKPMTVDVAAKYERPGGKYTAARGSVQMLDNGNAFVGWAKHSLQSEHAPDGRTLMQAQFRHEGANTYRAYKYEWVGRPQAPPDVHSAAIDGVKEEVNTIVHVSWNGATEVHSWNLYKTNPNGEGRELVGSTLRQGFESMISYQGYASYVVVEALDADGNALGESRTIETLPPSDLISHVVADEAQWLQAHSVTSQSGSRLSVLESPIVTYILGVVSCAITVLVAALLWRARHGGSSWMQRKPYEPVGEKELDEEDFNEDTMVEEMNERMEFQKGEV